MAEKMVLVQCIWPPERGAKDDCRGHTGIVWDGHGDVKEYPARLWHKLAEHPGVWKLYDPEAEQRIAAANEAAAKAKESADRAAAEAEAIRQAELSRIAEAARVAGAQTGTDVVVGTVDTNPDGAQTATLASAQPPAQTNGPKVYTPEELAAMPDEDIKAIAEQRDYGLHRRLSPTNLRKHFLIAQNGGSDSEGGEG